MRTTPLLLRERAPQLSVSILAADLLRLGAELEVLAEAGAEVVHIDVMDGVFCPAMTVGPPLVKAIPDRFVKDVHLMIDEPLPKVGAYIDAGAGILTFHLESTRHPHRVLQSLAGSGVVRGLALNPGTPVSAAGPLLDEVDLLVLLAINPGFSGQSFIPSTCRRVAEARALLADRPIALAVDGGITKANVQDVAALGADVIVTGSAVYEGKAPAVNLPAMHAAAARARSEGAGLA